MKKNTIKSEKQTAKDKNELAMVNLINAALMRYDAEQLMEMLYEKCCNGRQMDDMKDKMISILTLEGDMVVKMNTGLDKKAKLIEYIEKEIYPYHNEQQANIFSF